MVKIKYEKDIYEFNTLEFNELKEQISERLALQQHRLKLIFKGKLVTNDFIFEADMTILLVASGDILAEAPEPEKPRIKGGKYHVSLKNKKSSNIASPYKFQRIETLPGLADRDKAYSILETLANDPGVLECMKKHKWSVGCLAELAPDGQVGVDPVCVLGLNQNHGQKILLRIRTDDLKGFRKTLSIKKVLYHELAHNVYGDHNDDFYMLMRQIEREATNLNWRNSNGRALGIAAETHTGFDDDVNENDNEQTVFRLDEGIDYIHMDEETQELFDDAKTPAEKAAIAALLRNSCTECSPNPSDAKTVEEKELGTNIKAKVDIDLTETMDVVDVDVDVDTKEYESAMAEDSASTFSSSSSSPSVVHTINTIQTMSPAAVYELLTDNIDRFIAEAIVLSSGLDDRMTMMREALCKFLLRNTQDQDEVSILALKELSETLVAVQKIIDKAKGSDDPKYRSINSSSRIFINRIQSKYATDVLIAAGFTKKEDKFVMNRYDPALLYCMSSLLDTASNILISVA